MNDHLLTLNAGSSSLKAALFEMVPPGAPKPVWSGQVDGLGAGATPKLKVRSRDGRLLLDTALDTALDTTPDTALDKESDKKSDTASDKSTSHDAALAALLGWHRRQPGAARIVGVGHRIVHGGTQFTQPVRVTDRVLEQLTALTPLAPLHQPHNLAGVRAAIAAFGGVPQVACFDTAFHAGQADVNQRFAIPRALHNGGVRRYGFHGLSYESIVAGFGALDARLATGRVVVAHLGNGASLCAIERGRSVATTMTFSPLDGLAMGTRCGHLDAAAVLYLMQAKGMTAERVTTLLYRESGLLGLSGVSSDMRVLETSSLPHAADAIGHFVEQVVQQIGTMAAALRGVDAVVFTGGIGEHSGALRQRVLRELAWLGVRHDPARIDGPRLTVDDSPVAAWVATTDEEGVIAAHTARVLAASASA